jgi:hypothetical protein
MLKISFWFKKLSDNKENLEHMTIDNPKKVLDGELVGLYACEIYLPLPDIEKKQYLIYSVNPIEALCLASEFVKVQLQFLINSGVYAVSEVESKEP